MAMPWYADSYDHPDTASAGQTQKHQQRAVEAQQVVICQLAELRAIEQEILQGIEELEGMLR